MFESTCEVAAERSNAAHKRDATGGDWGHPFVLIRIRMGAILGI